MTQMLRLEKMFRAISVAAICMALTPAFAANDAASDLLPRVKDQVAKYLDQFSEVKCSEKVKQEKINAGGKVELQRDSTYDYLVILTNSGGEVSLDESRLAVGQAKADKKNRPLLVTNGFATLFLISILITKKAFSSRRETSNS